MALNYGKRSGLIGSGLHYLDTGIAPTWNPEIREYESNNVPNLPYPEAFDQSFRPFQGQTRSPVTNGSTGAEESSAYEHLRASNSDEATNARFQDLVQREAELKDRISELEMEINWQEKLRENEMSKDPMWEVAKLQFIQKGDSTALENIMNRKSMAEQAKMNRSAEDKSKTEANLRAAQSSRAILQNAYDEFMAGKSSKTNQIQGRANLFRAFQDFKEKAEAAGKKPEDFFTDTTFLPNVQLELDEALTAMKEETDTKVANAKNTAAVQAENKKVSDIVDGWNSRSHNSVEIRNKKKDLEKSYPNFIFTAKNGKIEWKRKAGK